MTLICDWESYAKVLKANQVDWDLFTVLEVDPVANLVRRSYSSDKINYPSGGVKALMHSDWAKQVIFEASPFISKDEVTFRAAFGDYELLESMGLRYALNVPVVAGGRVVRTLNLLRRSSAYEVKDERILLDFLRGQVRTHD